MQSKMKRKTLLIAVLAAAFVFAPPVVSVAQHEFFEEEGSWGRLGGSGTDDNINNGSGTWGLFTNSGIGNNGSGTWGLFTNSGIGDNSQGNGSWGNFNNDDPVALTDGLILLVAASMAYGPLKRRKAQKHEL